MLSQNQVKHITALRVKKYREEYGEFIAEGHKLVMDLLDSGFKIAGIYASAYWIVNNLSTVREKEIPLYETLPRGKEIPIYETLPREMKRISALNTPSPVLAVVKIPDDKFEESSIMDQIFKSSNLQIFKLILALDDIRDPGNLGTIIRIADWFGINTMLCSENCVDVYNPKVVQATMGSIARVKAIYCDLVETIKGLDTLTGYPDGFPVYGALLEGESIFSQTLTDHGIIIIGNESRGISPDLIPLITRKIFIPSFGNASVGRAESLNASIAAAIICAEFRRNNSMEG